MSYIAQTYDPHVVSNWDRICEIAELAKKDIFPNTTYTDYEVQIWVLMRECIEDAIDSRNHYDSKKGVRISSQLLQGL